MSTAKDLYGRPSEEASRLLLSASQQHMIQNASQELDSLFRKSTETPFLLVAFLKDYPQMAEELVERLGVDRTLLEEALRREMPPEPQPGPPSQSENPTEDQIQAYTLEREMYDDRRANRELEPMSAKVTEAMRHAGTTAKADGKVRSCVGDLIAAVLELDTNARMAVMGITTPKAMESAIRWLRAQPDPAEEVGFLEKVHRDAKLQLEKLWPKLQAESVANNAWLFEIKDRRYEEDPSAYEEPLDISAHWAEKLVSPEQEYSWRSIVCLHAAENEARIRRSANVTVDHMLLALLRDGTDTAAFFDRLGVDRTEWTRRLDAALPRRAEGPRWPERDHGLTLCATSNYEVRRKELPGDVKWEELSSEEMKPYLEHVINQDRRFTDLHYIKTVPYEPNTLSYALFREAGIGRDLIDSEIEARETGDPLWWQKRPDLIRQLQEVFDSTGVLGLGYCKSQVCIDTAQFEARMRRAPKTEFDDLLVALLVPGTDLWQLIESLGHNPANAAEEISSSRRFYENGIFFPPVDELVNVYIGTDSRFSDLAFVLWGIRHEAWAPSEGLRLLAERGVTMEVIERRLGELGVDVQGFCF